jgi:hypothetical protein
MIVRAGAPRFVFPSVGARGIGRVHIERDWEFAIGGVLFLALGVLMLYLVARG